MASKSKDEFVPTKEDAMLAKQALNSLSKVYKNRELKLEKTMSIEKLAMPAGVVRLLLELLNQTAQGHAVTIITSTKEFSTQEAADILNVSRPFVLKLLADGKIPHSKVDRHQRIKATDLFAYKKKSETLNKEALDELAAMAQVSGLGYE